MRSRVLFHVNHLWGQGHFVRVHEIARAIASEGGHATIMNGGLDVPRDAVTGVSVINMPPVRSADERYTRLLDEKGAALTDEFRAMRAQLCRDIFETQAPDVLVTETWPFGRRKLAFELEPLVAAARAKDIPVYSSVRDILTCPEDARVTEAHQRLHAGFAGVLVHGDPRISTLKDSWPRAGEIRAAMHDTGYVTEIFSSGSPGLAGERRGVVVSAGAGASGEAVLMAAAAAREAGAFSAEPWLFVTGPKARKGLEEVLGARLAGASGAGITIEREVHPLGPAIRAARFSIGRGGYNSVIEAASSGTRMVVVPHVRMGEDEQLVRARAFEARGLLALANHEIIEAGGHPARDAMIAALARAASMAAPKPSQLNLDGARQSARILLASTARNR